MISNKYFFPIVLFVGLLLCSFKLINLNNESVVIYLNSKSVLANFFDEDAIDNDDYVTHKIYNFDRYPKYYKYLKTICKGLPQNDSIEYYVCLRDYPFIYDFVRSGDMSYRNMEGFFRGEDIDSLNFSKVKLKSSLVIAVGFFKDKQFLIADTNRNRDFSDEVKFEYNINFRNNLIDQKTVLNSQPIAEYQYEDIYKGNIIKHNRKFILYPDRNNPYSLSSTINANKHREYFGILKLNDFWEGDAIINNQSIVINYYGESSWFGAFTARLLSDKKKITKSYFKYRANQNQNDTISIGGIKLKIDSISRDISKVYLKKVIPPKINYGYLKGDYIKNFNYQSLNNRNLKLKTIQNLKKYTLIEFWGTWCAPCIKLTPKLITTYRTLSHKLNIISIAVDKNTDVVNNYVAQNKLKWNFGFISDNTSWENGIIKKLKIKAYPTFILLNNKGKIIDRGYGEDLNEILKNIK